jgi:hypothetical protein
LNLEWLSLHSDFWCSSHTILCSTLHHSMGHKLWARVRSETQCIQLHTYTIQITKIEVKTIMQSQNTLWNSCFFTR